MLSLGLLIIEYHEVLTIVKALKNGYNNHGLGGVYLKRVIAYIDGFNLYFGLMTKGWGRYRWLNLQLLAENLLKQDQKLVFTKYCTARVASPPEKQKRQSTYIEALETLKDFGIFYGKYQLNPVECRRCGWQSKQPNEKMTDVNIAVEMLKDAYRDAFDVALLISADSDLVPAIDAVKQLSPNKRIVIAFPPARKSLEMTKHAHAYFTIGEANIAKSLFPKKVQRADGYTLERPPLWK
jgi:uncharacterized LabA/DUF88 family protein